MGQVCNPIIATLKFRISKSNNASRKCGNHVKINMELLQKLK